MNCVGFDRSDFDHAALKPLQKRQAFASFFALPEKNQLRQNRFVTDSRQALSNFCFLRRRLADASQGEKGERCRKGALTGGMGSGPVSLYKGEMLNDAF